MTRWSLEETLADWNGWGRRARDREPELGPGVSAREHTMGRVEYKLERVIWIDEHEARLDQLMDHINEWAKDGWRVASVDLTLLGSFGLKKLPVLLERDVPQST